MTSRRRHALLAFLSTVLGVTAALLLAEAAGQVYALLHPAYDVLYLQADPVLGWRHVPGLTWTWTDRHGWYARDFSVEVTADRNGFRDTEEPGRRPIVLLGDSFIEAIQVPRQLTAGRLIQDQLGKRVLNYGVSNYSIGQYLLVWREAAAATRPSVVVAFVGTYELGRIGRQEEHGAFPRTSSRRLAVRPVFKLAGDRLIYEPARDIVAFQALQDDVMHHELHGSHSRRRHGLFLRSLWQSLRATLAASQTRRSPTPPEVVAVNLAVLSVLNREVSASGARLVIADASTWMNPADARVAATLHAWASREGVAYISLSPALMAKEAAGIPVRWQHDEHFNLEGNHVIATAIVAWARKNPDLAR
jgi:hypothetical protein